MTDRRPGGWDHHNFGVQVTRWEHHVSNLPLKRSHFNQLVRTADSQGLPRPVLIPTWHQAWGKV